MHRRTSKVNVFVYDWTYKDENGDDGKWYTIIRAYGITASKNRVYLKIEGFTPFCYIELPTIIQGKDFVWNSVKVKLLIDKIETMNRSDNRPLTKSLQYKYKLYGNQKKKIGSKYEEKMFPYLLLTFSSIRAISSFTRSLARDIPIMGIGRVKYRVFESDWGITPIIKLLALRKLPSSGWIEAFGVQIEDKESNCDIEMTCKFTDLNALDRIDIPFPKILSFDIECYSHKWKSGGFPSPKNIEDKVFQIGVVISQNTKYSLDNVYKKILLTLSLGVKDSKLKKNKFLGGIEVRAFNTERELILELPKIVQEEKPSVIIGYNIFGFDFEYLFVRAKDDSATGNVINKFSKFGCLSSINDNVDMSEGAGLESKAFGKNKRSVKLDSEGILYIDVLPCVRFSYKLPNYKLSTITEYFKVSLKDPLTPKDIFMMYEKATANSLGEVGKYCVQDCLSTTQLFEKLNLWVGLCEESRTNHVPIIYLYTRGQQIKMFSQVYEHCFHSNRIVETNVYEAKSNEKYQGAIVLEPVEGLSEEVVAEDFQSLYPSIIIAYNIDYTTLVDPDDNVPDNDCNVCEWEEHINCEHDMKFVEKEEKKKQREEKRVENAKKKALKGLLKLPLNPPKLVFLEREECENDTRCDEKSDKKGDKKDDKKNDDKKVDNKKGGKDEKDLLKKVSLDMEDDEKDSKKRKICGKFCYKWLKHEAIGRGIIPTLIDNLLSARKATRAELKDKTKLLDSQRKLLEGKLTSEERKKIELKISEIEVQCVVLDKRQLSYKVSANSMYGAMGVKRGYLPFLPGAMSVTYKGRVSIGKAIDLIKTEFGGKILYGDTDSCMCIFPFLKDKIPDTKKRLKELTNLGQKISKRSEILYPKPMRLDFENKIYNQFLILSKKRYITQVCDENGKIDPELNKKGIALQRRDFCTFMKDIYKMVVDMIFNKDPLDSILNRLVEYINKLFQREYKIDDFIVTKSLSREVNEYKTKPAHVILVERMRRRGQDVSAGSRIGYIFTTNDRYSKKEKKEIKQADKVEDEEYFKENREILRIDYLYYLEKQAVKPIDEILTTTFGDKVTRTIKMKRSKHEKTIGFMHQQFIFRKFKNEINRQIESLGEAKIELVNSDYIPML